MSLLMGMNYLRGEVFKNKRGATIKILKVLPISKDASHAREEGEIPNMEYVINYSGNELKVRYLDLEHLIWGYLGN